MSDVFISYSRKDKAFATRLHEALKARQRKPWVDLEDIPPTAEWREKINAGIEGVRAFVFVLSPDSMVSPECLKEIDHAATRVRAEDRDEAIVEFMELTNYRFDFAIYVKVFNSITNVARLTAADYAMVFTSGIAPYVDDDVSGPTEKFIHNFGPRVHHVAFRTERIERVFSSLKRDGMEFLIELVGSRNEGLKQTFTMPSPVTMLVTEYIHRYGDFDGFFTKSNVTLLTGATGRQ